MDGHKFDTLAKGMATPSTRRGFIVTLGAAVAGTLLRPERARAGPCATQGQSCTANKCCRGYTCLIDETSGTDRFCCQNALICGGRCCPTGSACVGGNCICPAGEVPCPNADPNNPVGKCVNLLTNPENCGQCGLSCGPGHLCCNGNCADPLTDEQNCGACGNACGANETCIGGVCCPNARVCGNTCLATACDATQCEVCDPAQNRCVSTCVAGETCTNGVCADICGPTTCTGCCDGGECKAGTTNQTCGAGGGLCVSCPSGTRCVNGACVCDSTSCPNGCCQNNVCAAGTTVAACGKRGATCRVCDAASGQVCCAPGTHHEQDCKKPTGATCTSNGECCSNSCPGRPGTTRICA